jgi:uncharacterized phage protein gp47/JayE
MSTTPTITALTSSGLVVSLLEDRIAQWTAMLQSIFGPTINVDPNAIDGQVVGIVANSINNLDQLVEAVYNAFNPATATGAALSLLVQSAGLTRNLGSYSTAPLGITGTAFTTTVPSGSLVKSADGSTTWTTTTDVTIDSTGTAQVTAQCSVIGSVAASAGTLTIIGSPVYGWQTVTNIADATLGASQETDDELRQRFFASVGNPAQGIIESIYAAIANVTGVTQCQVYENFTDSSTVSEDNPYGLAPHSMNAVALGGADVDIRTAIWLKRSGGLTMLGANVGTIIDKYGNTRTISFDRPTDVPIYIVANIVQRLGFPTGGAQLIQAALAAWGILNQLIGVDVIQSELYTPINTIAGVSISSLYVGTAANPTSSDNIEIPYNGIATFSAANIVVNIT